MLYSPEWPLDKVTIIAGSTFPVAAAVGDFDEATARLVEQRISFGSAFDGARFAPVGSEGHQVPGQIEQQIFPQGSSQFSIGRLSHGGAVLSEGIQTSLETDPL
jgi:hypothetical protein